MTKRKAMTPARKARILLAHDSKCWRCGIEFIDGDKVEFDHKQAIGRGGSDEDENIGPCHDDPCHKLKTFGSKAKRLGADVFEIAKTKRLKKKHSEPRKTGSIQSRGFGSSKFKKKFDGSVVKRDAS